jgi:hypothetical protein
MRRVGRRALPLPSHLLRQSVATKDIFIGGLINEEKRRGATPWTKLRMKSAKDSKQKMLPQLTAPNSLTHWPPPLPILDKRTQRKSKMNGAEWWENWEEKSQRRKEWERWRERETERQRGRSSVRGQRSRERENREEKVAVAVVHKIFKF